MFVVGVGVFEAGVFEAGVFETAGAGVFEAATFEVDVVWAAANDDVREGVTDIGGTDTPVDDEVDTDADTDAGVDTTGVIDDVVAVTDDIVLGNSEPDDCDEAVFAVELEADEVISELVCATTNPTDKSIPNNNMLFFDVCYGKSNENNPCLPVAHEYGTYRYNMKCTYA